MNDDPKKETQNKVIYYDDTGYVAEPDPLIQANWICLEDFIEDAWLEETIRFFARATIFGGLLFLALQTNVCHADDGSSSKKKKIQIIENSVYKKKTQTMTGLRQEQEQKRMLDQQTVTENAVKKGLAEANATAARIAKETVKAEFEKQRTNPESVPMFPSLPPQKPGPGFRPWGEIMRKPKKSVDPTVLEELIFIIMPRLDEIERLMLLQQKMLNFRGGGLINIIGGAATAWFGPRMLTDLTKVGMHMFDNWQERSRKNEELKQKKEELTQKKEEFGLHEKDLELRKAQEERNFEISKIDRLIALLKIGVQNWKGLAFLLLLPANIKTVFAKKTLSAIGTSLPNDLQPVSKAKWRDILLKLINEQPYVVIGAALGLSFGLFYLIHFLFIARSADGRKVDQVFDHFSQATERDAEVMRGIALNKMDRVEQLHEETNMRLKEDLFASKQETKAEQLKVHTCVNNYNDLKLQKQGISHLLGECREQLELQRESAKYCYEKMTTSSDNTKKIPLPSKMPAARPSRKPLLEGDKKPGFQRVIDPTLPPEQSPEPEVENLLGDNAFTDMRIEDATLFGQIGIFVENITPAHLLEIDLNPDRY